MFDAATTARSKGNLSFGVLHAIDCILDVFVSTIVDVPRPNVDTDHGLCTRLFAESKVLIQAHPLAVGNILTCIVFGIVPVAREDSGGLVPVLELDNGPTWETSDSDIRLSSPFSDSPISVD